MKKTKQIYLLIIIIAGIVTLSVYSTYSIFTYESETSDIVSIHTPNTLNILMDTSEYKQLTIPNNSYVTADIDIYNNYNDELCYSIWYKPISKDNIDNKKIKIYENTNETLTTSGTLEKVTNRRVNLIITNDNDKAAKVNIGLSTAINYGTCELNMSIDKLIIQETINNPTELGKHIIDNINTKHNEAGYITYKNETSKLVFPDRVYLSTTFDYQDELFTLKDPVEVTKEEILTYKNISNYYTCIDTNSCKNLYHITNIESETNNDTTEVWISKYDILKGYLAGDIGLRKVNDNYYYFGDNPNNYIYYNCLNEQDKNTCELWQILGLIKDDNNEYITKIIRHKPLEASIYSEKDALWSNSTINKYLNETYKITNPEYLHELTFNQESLDDLTKTINDFKPLEKDNHNKVTIMNLSDYLNTSMCKHNNIEDYKEICFRNNWLNIGYTEWTMTKKNEIKKTVDELSETDEEITEPTIEPINDILYSISNKIDETKISESLNIRPVVYLNKRVLLINGDGSFENPYMIR